MPPSDYFWIAGVMHMLEIRRGPFWEPPRPHPATDYADLLAIADDFEPLMRRLVIGRRKSFALLGLGAAMLASGVALMRLVPGTIFLYADVAFAVVFGAVIFWFQVTSWRGGWLVLWYSATLPPSRPAPPASQIIDGLRRLSDAFTTAGDSAAVRALAAMRDRTPLTYEACVRLTVTSSAVQRAARAA